MTHRRRLPLALALAIGPATFAACDLLITEPAPASSEIGIAFQIEGTPLGGSATAFSRVRRIGLRFIRPDSSVRDTVIAVVPVDGVIRTGIVVPATERVAALGVQARLGYDTIALFQGSAIVEIVAGSPTTAEVSLSPVPDRVVADLAQLSLAGPGATNVVSARVLFASGDTIDGLSGIWSSADPGIAAVGPNGTVLAQGPGLTNLEVRFGTLTDTVAVEVLPPPPPPPPPPPTGGPNRWIEALGGLWSDPANWSLGRIPILGDTVVIDLDGIFSVDIDLDIPVLSAIRVGASVGSQTVTVSGRVVATAGIVTVAGTGSLILDGTTLTSAGLVVEAGASLTLRGGAVVNAPLTNGGDVLADNGGAFLNGAVTVAAGASLRVGGGTVDSSLTIATGFSNDGLIELSGGARLTVANGTLVNASGGVIAGVSGPIGGSAFLTAELDNRGTFSIDAALELDAAGVAHVNVGTLISTAGASVRITGADAFANAGVLDLGTSSVDVTLSGSGIGFTTSGSIAVGGGQLSIYNGPYAHTEGGISGGGTLRLFDLTATASVPLTLGTNVPTSFQLRGSILSAPGVTTASGTGFLLDASTLNGALTNQGSFTAIGAGVSTVVGAAGSASGATITVESGVGGDTELLFAGGLTNAGFLVLTNSTGATGALLTVSGGVLVNAPTGTVDAATGGGARVITAEIDNQGIISSNLDLTIDATGTTLTNSGTLTTNTADAIAVVGVDAFLNTGTVNAAPGSISIGLSGAGAGLTNSANLIVGAGATLSVDNGMFASSPTGGIGGAGLLELVGVTATFGSPIPFTLGTTGPAAVRLEGSTLTAAGVVVDTTTTLTLEGSTLDAPFESRGVLAVAEGVSDVTGAMTTGPTGAIRVTGGSTVDATLGVANGFTNNGLIELTSAGVGGATLAIGNGALTNGGSGVITSTTSAGSGGVRTIAAAVSQAGAIALQAPLTIAGQLVDPAGVPSTYAGNGNGLTVSGLNVSGAVFDDMPLTSIGGSLTLFTGSTFQNMDPTATQLTIEHPGTLAGLLSFSSLTFATPPTQGVGYYMRVTDTDPATLPLIIEVLLSSPLLGGLLSLVSGGAGLVW
jgi:hypothetical protein